MTDEADRLKALWAGSFGDAYTQRNRAAGAGRAPFWGRLLAKHPVSKVLEVGCNLGANLSNIAGHGPAVVAGVDVNDSALRELRRAVPEVRAVRASGGALPFADGSFDLAFTMGVLIHQPPEVLPGFMGEVVRCSRRYVLCGEYFSEELTEVPYRGQSGALFKRDFGGLYGELFPHLRLVDRGFLARDDGWDDVTWWLFEQPAPGAGAKAGP